MEKLNIHVFFFIFKILRSLNFIEVTEFWKCVIYLLVSLLIWEKGWFDGMFVSAVLVFMQIIENNLNFNWLGKSTYFLVYDHGLIQLVHKKRWTK